MNWGGEESSTLSTCWMVQAGLEVNHPLVSFGRRLESAVRARARALAVLATGEEALAKEE